MFARVPLMNAASPSRAQPHVKFSTSPAPPASVSSDTNSSIVLKKNLQGIHFFLFFFFRKKRLAQKIWEGPSVSTEALKNLPKHMHNENDESPKNVYWWRFTNWDANIQRAPKRDRIPDVPAPSLESKVS